MKKNPVSPLTIVGLFLASLSVLSLFIFSGPAPTSPSELYGRGISQFIFGVAGLTGACILIIEGVRSYQRTSATANTCNHCGAKIEARNDKFCRKCGGALKK
jgi:hypothetical protein